jgi:hypothetical protein
MIDQFFVSAVAAALETALPGVFIGAQHTRDEIVLPAVLLKLESDAVVGGPLFRGTLEAAIVSHGVDSTTADHAQLVRDLDDAMRNLTFDSDAVELYGVVPTSSIPSIDNNQWHSSLSYIVGFGPKP